MGVDLESRMNQPKELSLAEVSSVSGGESTDAALEPQHLLLARTIAPMSLASEPSPEPSPGPLPTW